MDTFTPGEAAKLTGIPGSTIRRYVAAYSEFLSSEATRKRSRRFTEKDIQVLSRIRDLYKEGNTQDKVLEMIPEIAEQIESPDPNSNEVPPSALMLINQLGAIQQSQQEQIDEMRNQLIELADLLEQERNKSFFRKLFG